jgi:hypothetical protein
MEKIKIESRFSKNEKAWFFHQNRITEGTIEGLANVHFNEIHLDVIIGNEVLQCRLTVKENDLFKSRAELIKQVLGLDQYSYGGIDMFMSGMPTPAFQDMINKVFETITEKKLLSKEAIEALNTWQLYKLIHPYGNHADFSLLERMFTGKGESREFLLKMALEKHKSE